MTITKLTYSFALLALFAFAGTTSAQTASVPRLQMTANVVSAMRLDISQHASGAAVSGSAGAFSISFGDVNSLGISPAANVTAAVTPGAGAAGFALYTTPIVLTPVYSGITGSANIALTIGSGANDALAFEGDSPAGVTLAAARVVIASSLSDVPNTRYVGFKISKLETAGSKTAVLVYTMTVTP
ncbi:MAG: hypothetical protein ND895_25885 [Pyrinomonadaceae bacterium]|nr:hypothetical protein [Pyrinomonadaceae bacterium]